MYYANHKSSNSSVHKMGKTKEIGKPFNIPDNWAGATTLILHEPYFGKKNLPNTGD